MRIYRSTAILITFILLFSMASCKGGNEEETSEENSAGNETVYSEESFSFYETTAAFQEITEAAKTEITTQAAPTQALTTEAQTEAVTENVTDVSLWNTDEIVSFYKSCAGNTGKLISSEQIVELADISVNNGALGGMFSFVTPILSGFLSGNATVTEGITGEYELLSSSDVASAKAYKTANGTVIEMTLNPQTSKASDDTSSGSVAHAITVVGDFAEIMKQLNEAGLPIDIPAQKAQITYSQPTVKVLVDSNNKIVNGTWSCDVEISLSDYKFAGAKVDSTVVKLKNTITAGGGFSA